MNNTVSYSLPPSSDVQELSRGRYVTYCFFIIIISVLRLSFIFKGTRALIDESRYSFSLRALDSLTKKDITGFFYYLASTAGRPGNALLNLIPASIQGALFFVFGINPDTPPSYLVPLLFNCLVVTASMFLLYKISLLVWHNREVALIIVIIYSCLINSSIYIRHLLPYDMGVLLALYITWRLLRILAHGYRVTNAQAFEMGALAMFLLAEYPGYYIIVPIAGIMLVDWQNVTKKFLEHVRLGILYVLGVVFVFGVFEGLARLGGVSFLERSVTLSGTINQGSFEEGFSFLFKYLFQVEGVLGYLIVGCMVAYFVQVLFRMYQAGKMALIVATITQPKYVLLICFTLGFLYHAYSSYFLYKMVFYGRLIHFYVPYIILFFVGSVVVQALTYSKQSGLLISLGALISFVYFSVTYLKLDYPRDILYRYNIDTTSPNVRYVTEVPVPVLHLYKSAMVFKKGGAYTQYPGTITLVNCALLYPILKETYPSYTPPSNSRLLYEGDYFGAYPAYLFEGLNIKEREVVEKRGFKFRIYNN
jgi:hypothetical protein